MGSRPVASTRWWRYASGGAGGMSLRLRIESPDQLSAADCDALWHLRRPAEKDLEW